jgi:hypothetical protein
LANSYQLFTFFSWKNRRAALHYIKKKMAQEPSYNTPQTPH